MMTPFGNANASGNASYSLTLQIEEEPTALNFECTLERAGKSDTTTIHFEIGANASNLVSMHIPIHTAPFVLCVGKCVGKSLIGPIIECIRTASPRTPSEVAKCLKRKAAVISAEALACAIECAATHGV
jgi:hypothetical protein